MWLVVLDGLMMVEFLIDNGGDGDDYGIEMNNCVGKSMLLWIFVMLLWLSVGAVYVF